MRTFFGLIISIIILILSLPVCLVIWVFSPKGKFAPVSNAANKCVMFLSKIFCKIAGCDYEIRGSENLINGPCVFVGNHQGNFDVLLVQFALGNPKITMTKKEASYVPIANLWMLLIHCIFVDRKNIKKSIDSMKLSIEYIKKGFQVLYFPEGTRSKGPNMGKFKGGAFKSAIECEVPLLPFVIDGSYKVYERQGYMKKEKVIVSILPAINVSKEDNIKELSERTKDIIQNELDNIRHNVCN